MATAETAVPDLAGGLRDRLCELTVADESRLRRRLDGALRSTDPRRRAGALARVAADVQAAQGRVERRAASLPAITYPEELPVSQRRDDIAAAIRDHQVVVVAGETGSGKTTQLPKICLGLGRGIRGQIGHTQPRRIAARAVADRVAEELGTRLGAQVGYQVRFTATTSEQTLVKVMTDGILLAEIQHDRELLRYDTLVIDEAHERSLNIDFILGYLKQLLPRRPDLKVVITSATIDPHRFAAHFPDARGRPAPVVEVSGRTYPVETRYRPPGWYGADRPDADTDQVQQILDAVDELAGEGPGDLLVFLSGEREIRDTAEALRQHTKGRRDPPEILPLYARLSAAEQHRVFRPHPGRRIVLATNVAETSLTVPGIRYVIDPGTARISRYSARLKVQRLPIEPVSQASANQRKGRCGRTADGICVRLYSEEDFAGRPEFTDPEILRTSLASVILHMSAIGLGDVAAFPFLDAPDRRAIRDGVALLHELGAVDPGEADPRRRLTDLGRRLAQLPLDPRMGRMVLEADRNGCLEEVLVIAAALSIQDPRERPSDNPQAADEKHRRFADPGSDLIAYLTLWAHLRERQAALSGSAFRRECRADYLHYLRIREWQDLVAQLRQIAKGLGITANATPADPVRVHRSLLAGLLSHVGVRDVERNDYLGARGARFAVFPGSVLFRKPPRWVMAAELVETTRLWARDCARIEPEWVEPLAQHLVKRTYSEPHWSKDAAAVMAYEKVTLYGVPLVSGRRVAYGGIDPELSRELFLRHALVEGDWRTHHRFFHDNRALLAEVEDLEEKARRRDLLVDDEALFAFYDERVPADVVSGRHFDAWWKRVARTQPHLLSFERSMLVAADAAAVSEADYPDTWTAAGGLALRLSYQFEPGADADGVTVHLPIEVLNQVPAGGFDWQIPGLREQLVAALIRSLPKSLRTRLVPAPDRARAVLPRLSAYGRDVALTVALGRELFALTGVVVPDDAWDLTRVPDHLQMTFRVEDEAGRTLGEGKDLEALRARLGPRLRRAIARAADSVERTGLRTWSIGSLPRTFEERRGGRVVRGFPALVDEGTSVAVRILPTEHEQSVAMARGTRRLLLLALPSPVTTVVAGLAAPDRLALATSPYPSTQALLDDCVAAAVDALVAERGGPAWDDEAFARLREHVRAGLVERTAEVVAGAARVLTVHRSVQQQLRGASSLAVLPALTDIREQVADLVADGFVSAAGARRLPDLARYLRAVERRLERLPHSPQRDLASMSTVHRLQERWAAAVDAVPATRPVPAELSEVRWMLEELRVSLFAQTVGTAYPVSEKRVLSVLGGARG